MIRRLVALIMLGMATVGLLPWLQQAVAAYQAQVRLPADEQAVYQVLSTNGLVSCDVPTTIVLRRNLSRTDNFFRCTNNHGATVTLTWSALDAGGFISASGSDTLPANGTAACRSATLDAGNTADTRTVTFRGSTVADAGLYVQIHFTAQVTVQNGAGGLGGGCP